MSQDVDAVRLLIAEALARKTGGGPVEAWLPTADAVLEVFEVGRMPWPRSDTSIVVLTLAPATPADTQ